MGVKATSRHNNVPIDVSDATAGDHNATTPRSEARAATPLTRALEKQHSQRRKLDNVLDDIMGDPDDFRDLADSEAESDGGRWEDAVRAALEHEEAEVGAADQEIRSSKEVLPKSSRQSSGKRSNETSNSNRSGSPLMNGDPGCSGQDGKEKSSQDAGRKRSSSALAVDTLSKDIKVRSTKYFIIKSLNHHNIAKSIEKRIWATQAMNEPVLNDAFESADRVLLVFSVNMSGHFQGYAQMTSPIGRRRANVWSEANEGPNPWGGTFSVDWLRLYDLPFQKTVHLKNPLNFFKPVKISRDCQELGPDVGSALCALIDEGADREGRPKRKVTSADLVAFSAKRRREEAVGVADNGNHAGQHLRANYTNGGGRMPAAYPPHTRWEGHEVQRFSKSKSPHPAAERSLETERENGRDIRTRHPERPMERDRLRDRTRSSSRGRSTDLPVEADMLDLTYEEYLQRLGHSRDFRNGYEQGAPFFYNSSVQGHCGNWMGRNAGAGFQADQYSAYISNWYNRHGPSMVGGPFSGRGGMGNNYPVFRNTPNANFMGQGGAPGGEWQLPRGGDPRAGPNYLDHNGPPSRHIERIPRNYS